MNVTARTLSAALFAAALLAFAPASHAQPKPIRLIVPYPPGGPLDIVARALAEKVQPTLGAVIVDNQPGAGGNLGADLAAKAAPDGTTIVMGAVATHAINPWLFAKMPYDALRDFTPITGVARVPNVLVHVEALGSPELRARLAGLMAEPLATSPEPFAAFVKSENAKYERLVKASGAKVE